VLIFLLPDHLVTLAAERGSLDVFINNAGRVITHPLEVTEDE
jgi:hypothetical protein